MSFSILKIVEKASYNELEQLSNSLELVLSTDWTPGNRFFSRELKHLKKQVDVYVYPEGKQKEKPDEDKSDWRKKKS